MTVTSQHMEDKTWLAKLMVALSWTGTIGTAILSHINTLLTIACAAGSLVATVMAIRVAVVTIRIKEQEVIRSVIDRAKSALELCHECEHGTPPAVCPIPADRRPATCPHHES